MEPEITLIEMLETHVGSPDGIHVLTYLAGEVYPLPAELAEAFLSLGWALPCRVETDYPGGAPPAVVDDESGGEIEPSETQVAPKPVSKESASRTPRKRGGSK